MALIDQLTEMLGDVREARKILDEAYDVWLWREHPYQRPERLAYLLAEQRVKQRTKVGVLRRWRW
jgi:hypothetical protein